MARHRQSDDGGQTQVREFCASPSPRRHHKVSVLYEEPKVGDKLSGQVTYFLEVFFFLPVYYHPVYHTSLYKPKYSSTGHMNGCVLY